tara:strand:+ start:740 stop:1753 length:1014 start_codon:yes stop_codon:yes gene_type:complete
MSENKAMLIGAGVLGVIITLYFGVGKCYHIVPAMHRTIWTQFEAVKYEETSGPGFYWKSPFVTGVDMFVGKDKDEVPYTCGTTDGITFKGDMAITNQLLPENVLSTFLLYGKNPDKANIYDQAEFLMQSIAANMTAREFLVDKFTDIDDLMYIDLVKAQITAESGLLIVEGKVKVFKPTPTNSNIADIIKMEAEHQQSIRTADEKQKLDKKMSTLANEKQKAADELTRASNIAEQLRKSDSQGTELERQKAKLNAEKELAEIRHEMDRAKAKKEADIVIMAATADKEAGLELAKKNKELLNAEYLELRKIEALANNTKIYYGSDISGVVHWHSTKEL